MSRRGGSRPGEKEGEEAALVGEGEGVGGGLSRPAPHLRINDEQREGAGVVAGVLHAGLVVV